MQIHRDRLLPNTTYSSRIVPQFVRLRITSIVDAPFLNASLSIHHTLAQSVDTVTFFSLPVQKHPYRHCFSATRTSDVKGASDHDASRNVRLYKWTPAVIAFVSDITCILDVF
jgi:hypothetical protein